MYADHYHDQVQVDVGRDGEREIDVNPGQQIKPEAT